jgi:hypothetical protein
MILIQNIFLLILLFLLQGTIKITYTGYTYRVQDDVVLIPIDSSGQEIPISPPKKLPVWISWTQSTDSTWASALVYHEERCDTMEFINPKKNNGCFLLEKLNGKSCLQSHSIIGRARQHHDSIDISIGSFVSISYYGKRDSM